jgi:cob(I)alamin adenosyltransferase
MALFTGKGDDGTTKTFSCNQRISKSSKTAEALGSVDEVNSFLGFIKVNSKAKEFTIPDGRLFFEIIDEVQQNLFIVQAELAGADKKIVTEKVKKVEDIVNAIEKELPPIKSFFVSGGAELSTMCDFARTIVRRAERRVVDTHLEKMPEINPDTLAYLNRLSSLMYALARLANHKSGVDEEVPNYK